MIALKGELGVGKTSFARAFIHARGGAAEDGPSPTFTLTQSYALPRFTLVGATTRQGLMRRQLERILATPDLSRNTYELASKALGD